VVKIRLKRLGYKKNPTYRIVVIDSRLKREGAPIEELGYYNPKTKEMKLNKTSAQEWIKKGAQASETVAYLIKNCDDSGSLVSTQKTTVKLSIKAQAKAQAQKETKTQASQAVKENAAQEADNNNEAAETAAAANENEAPAANAAPEEAQDEVAQA
jgi:small subunit ribosomal protein S16